MNPLHIPLPSLPAPVQIGAPLVLPTAHGNLYAIVPPEAAPFLLSGDGWCIDLSPPPIDADGNPTRVDALPVLVDMLARAVGHPEGVRVFRGGSIRPSAWTLETWAHGENVSTFTLFTHDVGAPHDGTTHGGWTMAATETREIIRRLPRIPALASIDLTDPNATRLALVALLAARVWETA